MKKILSLFFIIGVFTNLSAQEFGDTKSQVLQKLKQDNQLDWYKDLGNSLVSVGPGGQTMSLDFKNNRLFSQGFTEPQASLFNARKSLSEYINKYKSQGFKVYQNDWGDVSNGGITCKYDGIKVYVLIQIINNKYHINHKTAYEVFE